MIYLWISTAVLVLAGLGIGIWLFLRRTPKWNKCTKASCWQGGNAEIRHMNILSPFMPEGMFKDRVKWMKGRGCNTAHVYVANQADGEFGGYCIYGQAWDWNIDKGFVKTMKKRIDYIRSKGLAVVVWIIADDSRWNAIIAQNFSKYAKDLKEQGLLSKASTVVLGLEMDTYYKNPAQIQALASAVRKVYKGKIGTHCTSGVLAYANFGDILFYQTRPGKNAAAIQAEAANAKALTGKPLNFFELSRHEDRALAEAAFKGGAFGVGNW